MEKGTMDRGLAKLGAIIYLYLNNDISGRQFVNRVDALVSNDEIDGISELCREDFDNLHEKLALCVWDAQTYSESPGLYINEAEMRQAVKEFVSEWGTVLARKIADV